MEEKFYKVSESELQDLISSWYILNALERGGVYNWDWYFDSIADSLKGFCKENNIPEDMQKNLDFYTIAEKELENYEEVK